MAKVTLNHVYKIYPGEKGSHVTAVEDVNLEIADREFVVLVGPSGCGKSTTLRMIAGLEEISRGDIYIGERRVNDVAPKDRDIAMVFQNYALYPHMSVFDNMAFGLKLRKYGKAEIKKRVGDAASILGIEGLLERKPKALSGGQRQRVAIEPRESRRKAARDGGHVVDVGKEVPAGDVDLPVEHHRGRAARARDVKPPGERHEVGEERDLDLGLVEQEPRVPREARLGVEEQRVGAADAVQQRREAEVERPDANADDVVLGLHAAAT